MALKVGILATHPIQYQAPLFRELAEHEEIDLTVYFCHKPSSEQQGIGFDRPFQWDIDLTEEYDHVWLKNLSQAPSLVKFRGCDTPEIKDIIRAESFAAFIVHGWNKKSSWQAFRACWKTGTPLLIRSDSHLKSQKSKLARFIKKLVYPVFITRFDACVAYGQWSEEYFRSFGAKNIFISPHCVDNTWFAKHCDLHRKEDEELRARFGLKKDTFIFLFVGKFEPKKRPLDVIEAMAFLVKKGMVNVELLMVGDGPLRSECVALARKKEIPVRFPGFTNQTEMPKVYAVSNVLVLPSDGGETWGLVANEAMACGLPVIVSDEVGCGPDLIEEGRTGYVFPMGNVAILARNMRAAVLDNATSQMRDTVRKTVNQYSAGVAASKLVDAVRFCVRQNLQQQASQNR